MGNSSIVEGRLKFFFDDSYQCIKFDDQEFYGNFKNCQPYGKGVDIIACSKNRMLIIEVKDFEGYEDTSKWRLETDSKTNEKCDRNSISLDVEIAEKVSGTIACIYGSRTYQDHSEKADVYKFCWENLQSDRIIKDKQRLFVVLHIEGKFNSDARRMKGHLSRIRQALKKRLDWLRCEVLVQNMESANSCFYTVKKTIVAN